MAIRLVLILNLIGCKGEGEWLFLLCDCFFVDFRGVEAVVDDPDFCFSGDVAGLEQGFFYSFRR